MSERSSRPARTEARFGKARFLAIALAAATMWLLASPLTAQAVTVPLDSATGNTSSAVQSATREFLTAGFPGKLPQGTPLDGIFGNGSCDTGNAVSPNLLPINRWGGVSSLHSRQSAWNSLQNYGPQTTTMSAYSAGNAFWQASASISSWASRLCFADTMGTTADNWVAKIGNAITSSPLVVILVVVGLAGVMIRRSGMKGMLRIVAAGAVLFIMVAGATKTTTTASGTEYGMGSPGWITNIINQVVSRAAAAPAVAMNGFVADSNKTAATTDDFTFGYFNCARYTNNLTSQYASSNGYGGFSSIIPASINAMWQQTGLKTYTAIQFGSNNPYGQKVYCRMLDMQAGIPVTGIGNTGTLALTQQAAWGVPTTNGLKDITLGTESYPFAVGTDNSKTDRAMIAWAACDVAVDGTISVDPEWAKVLDPNSALGDCTYFFKGKFPNDLDGNSVFNWEDSPDTIAQKAQTVSPAVADFLFSLHGDRISGSAGPVALLYAGSAFVTMLVFGLFSIAVVIAKIGMIGVTFMLLFSALQWLVVDNGDTSPVLKTLMQYASMSLLAFGANLILAIITVLSKAITDMTSSFGSGTVATVLAAGLAPLAATLMVHLFFTKGLKAPSPFKLTSALDYAKRAGNGSLVSDFADSAGAKFSRGRQMASQAGKQLAGRIRRNGGSAPVGGAAARQGAMGPLGAAVTGALSGAVGGAVAEKLHDHKEEAEEAEDAKEALDRQATGPLGVRPQEKLDMFSEHKARLGDPKRELTGKEALRWAKTGYLPQDGDGAKHAATLSMAKMAVADRAKAASGYFAKNRAQLLSGGKLTGGAAVAAGAVYAAGAVFAAPVALPAAVALGAYAAVRTVRTARGINKGIAASHKESTEALQKAALKAYGSDARRTSGYERTGEQEGQAPRRSMDAPRSAKQHVALPPVTAPGTRYVSTRTGAPDHTVEFPPLPAAHKPSLAERS